MMDELFYDAVDMLKGMISIQSFSRDEKNVADYVETRMKNLGFSPRRSGNNLWIIPSDFNPQKPTILLNSHLDTVKPSDEWSHDPFMPLEDENGRLFGLGSNDAGASLVTLFAAFRYLSTISQEYNLIFLASCEEEVGGKNGIESVIPMLPHIDVAIVGEPTNMQPAIAEKGLMVLDGAIHGISGHAARNEGVNAIYRTMELIEALRSIKFEKESALLGPVKVTVTQIEAGSQHNVIPDLCKIVVDVRTTDAYSNHETLEIIQNAVKHIDCSLTPRSTRLNSSKIDPVHPLINRLLTMGKEPFGSPTLSDQSLMPFQSFKMGPGNSSRSHTADEYILIDEMRDAIQTYISLLSKASL